MESRISYFALLIVITIGVTAGNLFSHWITDKYFDLEEKPLPEHKLEQIINNQSNVLPEKPSQTETPVTTQETIKLSPDNQTEREETKPPANSKQLHKDMNTPSSERGMNKHCAEYYDYLSFGSLPNSN
jgi:hypothetical protein